MFRTRTVTARTVFNRQVDAGDIAMSDSGAQRRERVGELARVAGTDPSALSEQVDELAAYLADDSVYVRRQTAAAVATLAETEPSAVAGLVDPLTDTLADETVRHDAAVGLAHVARAEPSALLGDVAALVATLDSDGRVVVPATNALASLADANPETLAQPGVLDRLFDLLAHDRAAVRRNATAALAAIAAVDAPAVCAGSADLRARLTDDAPAVREQAAVALGTAGPACPDALVAAVPDLADMLADSDGTVQSAAAYALGHAFRSDSGRERTVDVLAGALADGDERVRRHATFVLAAVAADDPDAVRPCVDALARRLADASPEVRHNARSALATLEGSYPEVVDDAVGDLVDRLERVDDETGTVAFTAAQLRGLAGDEDAPADQRAAADHALALVESGAVAPATPTAAGSSTADDGGGAGSSTADDGGGAGGADDGPRFCPSCGETLDDGGGFCPVCGTDVG